MRTKTEAREFIASLNTIRTWVIDNDAMEARDLYQDQINLLLEIAIGKLYEAIDYWGLPE
jgi:hypothetical protein